MPVIFLLWFGYNKLGYSLTNNPTVAMEMLHGSCDQLRIIFDIHSIVSISSSQF